MSRTVCGICGCPYDDLGNCACTSPKTLQDLLREEYRRNGTNYVMAAADRIDVLESEIQRLESLLADNELK